MEEKLKSEIKELELLIEETKNLIEITQKNMKNNFEDPNYKLVVDAMQLRKLNKKLKKYETKLQMTKDVLAALEENNNEKE